MDSRDKKLTKSFSAVPVQIWYRSSHTCKEHVGQVNCYLSLSQTQFFVRDIALFHFPVVSLLPTKDE